MIREAEHATYPPRAGNLVCPLVDGVAAFSRIGEAVDGARRRVWATIAFVDRTVQLPGGRGTVFDLLDRAGARGIDVRVVFWREPELDPAPPGWEHFPGNTAERAWLATRGSRFLARWDHLPRGCQHQKTWIVDAGEPGEVAFVGGINPDRMSIVPYGHAGSGEHYHDVHLELRGPSAADVHDNFVLRWNEASERGRADGIWPAGAPADDLRPPARPGHAQGQVRVQIGRTARAGRYAGLPNGEQSVREQYLAAIDGARRTIYLENQFFLSTVVYAHLDAALSRGVEVVALVPRVPLEQVREARANPRNAALFDALAALGRHERFTLAGLVATDADATCRDVYVHAKIALVDDAWMTVGSANLEQRALHSDTELNATCWDAEAARTLRRDLFAEHCDEDVAGRGDVDALGGFREVARANADRLRRGERLHGLAVAIDPARYAE